MRPTKALTALANGIALVWGAAAAAQAPERVGAPLPRDPGNAPLEDDRLGGDITEADELADEIEHQQELADKRSELEQMAETAIGNLRAENPRAAQAIDDAYGFAVFDTTKGGLIVTGAGGSGVARTHDAGEQTFMHVGGVGIGLGVGGENYKLVLVFDDPASYEDFVEGEWKLSGSAQAAAGNEGAASETLIDQPEVFRLTDGGLIAQADMTGLRFWPNDELNGDVDVAIVE